MFHILCNVSNAYNINQIVNTYFIWEIIPKILIFWYLHSSNLNNCNINIYFNQTLQILDWSFEKILLNLRVSLYLCGLKHVFRSLHQDLLNQKHLIQNNFDHYVSNFMNFNVYFWRCVFVCMYRKDYQKLSFFITVKYFLEAILTNQLKQRGWYYHISMIKLWPRIHVLHKKNLI